MTDCYDMMMPSSCRLSDMLKVIDRHRLYFTCNCPWPAARSLYIVMSAFSRKRISVGRWKPFNCC